MTDRSKFEQMLEHLINEEQDKAKELFHQLVVEKSREIYENILDEDFNEDDNEKNKDDTDPETESVEVTEAPFGGDETDDFIDDVEDKKDDEPVDDFGGEGDEDSEDEFSMDGDEPDKEEVLDAVEKLEDLLQRFLDAEEGDEGSEDEEDMPFDLEDEDDDMAKEEGLGESVKLTPVPAPKHGDDGAVAKSPVASKNDMGGTNENMTRGDEETGKGGTKGGLANPAVKDMKTGNVNVVGNKKAPKLQAVSKPKHGDDGDKGADSPLNGAPKRAK